MNIPDDELDDFDPDVCVHGIGFDEECEECEDDATEYDGLDYLSECGDK